MHPGGLPRGQENRVSLSRYVPLRVFQTLPDLCGFLLRRPSGQVLVLVLLLCWKGPRFQLVKPCLFTQTATCNCICTCVFGRRTGTALRLVGAKTELDGSSAGANKGASLCPITGGPLYRALSPGQSGAHPEQGDEQLGLCVLVRTGQYHCIVKALVTLLSSHEIFVVRMSCLTLKSTAAPFLCLALSSIHALCRARLYRQLDPP